MEIIKRKDRKDAHPYIPELKELYQKGRVTRREFLRNATLLGMSAAAAYAFISPFAPKKAMAAAMPKRGGTWKCGMSLQLIDHPARLSWTEGANVVRQVSEYLSDTGPDNITRPWLCEKWVASEDLKTWDLYIRKGVKFNDGQVMTADDIIFTIIGLVIGSACGGIVRRRTVPGHVDVANAVKGDGISIIITFST